MKDIDEKIVDKIETLFWKLSLEENQDERECLRQEIDELLDEISVFNQQLRELGKLH